MKALATLLLKLLILFYRLGISTWLPPRCRFLPTCSQYALDAIDRYGPYRGSILAFKRLCRCHPWGGHGHDPVKEEELYSLDFKNSGRHPSGESEERILIRDRGRILEPVPAKAGRQGPDSYLRGDKT